MFCWYPHFLLLRFVLFSHTFYASRLITTRSPSLLSSLINGPLCYALTVRSRISSTEPDPCNSLFCPLALGYPPLVLFLGVIVPLSAILYGILGVQRSRITCQTLCSNAFRFNILTSAYFYFIWIAFYSRKINSTVRMLLILAQYKHNWLILMTNVKSWVVRANR